MRKLNHEEKMLVKERKKEFKRFFEESMPVLIDFLERLGAYNPSLVIKEAGGFVDIVDDFMESQVIEDENRVWIQTRIGYFIGELLIQRYHGCWFLNKIPDSRYFAKFVVGEFSKIKNHFIMVDPFEVAFEYLKEPVGRSLKKYLNQIFEEIESFPSPEVDQGQTLNKSNWEWS